MNEFEGTFEFFCKPTKTADNKKTIVELTAGYDYEKFCKVEKFWDHKITVNIIKNSEKPKKYDFLVTDNKHNKGSKNIKTFTIYLSKLFDLNEHLELCDFLHQQVFVTWNQLQPDIDFGKNDNEIEIEEPDDPEDSDD